MSNNRQQYLGATQFVRLPDLERNNWGDQYVVNMFAQDRYGYDGFKYTNYEAFYQCLKEIKNFAKEHSIVKTIAFPYHIGCDRGGANWKIIFTMIYEVFKDTDFNIEIVSLGEIKE
jgi:O-acetyl-ADP-ribose deacetylase (regulator of RNase III)